jgi:CelD/BcsL family acetyltransferase involved in cellulose biosynthesis
MRAARLSVWSFDHLVGSDEKFEPYVTARDVSPQADLSAGYERYIQQCRASGSDEIMQAERKARKLAREIGEVHFTQHEARTEVMEQLISWKREQYHKSNLVDAFREPWTGELLRRIAHVQTPEFAGICSVLRVGDRIVAAHMGMRSRHIFHHWFPAYHREFARYSPGNILLLRMAQALAGSGVQTIDFGKGGLHWKQSFMTGTTELREGFVELPSLVTSARRLRRMAEAHAAQGGTAALLRFPLRAIRRIERIRRFR